MAKKHLDLDALEKAAQGASATIKSDDDPKALWENKSPGRPKKDQKRDRRIQVMLTEEEYKLFLKARNKAGFESDSSFARMVIVERASKAKG